jgi:membrane-bound lytic murein transglycosylase D
LKFIKNISLLLFSVTVLTANAQILPVTELELKQEEAAILELMDSLTKELFRHNYKFKKINGDITKNEAPVPLPSDDVLKDRLNKIPAVIPMDYNGHVKGFIDLYANRRREMMQRMLGLTDIYFPIFEAAIDKRGLPMELKNLAIVESALNPNAVSRVGATGIWQIMYTTARMLGLEINSYIDERRDPYLSTEAALNYLEQMHNLYDDWLLVIASYNCGPGNVNKAIRKAGGKRDFWSVYKFLPAETRGYVPAFIAVNYVMHYYKEHGIVPMPVTASFNAVDTVMVYRHLSLEHVATTLQVDLGELEMLNPSLKKKVIPASDNGYPLKLPLNKVALYEEKKAEIFSEDPERAKQIASNNNAPLVVPSFSYADKTKVYYTVKENETLDMIAAWFDCNVANLRNWNNVFGNTVSVGQKLVIHVPKPKADYYSAFDTMTIETKAVIFKEKRAASEAVALKNINSTTNSTKTEDTSEQAENGYKTITKKIPYTVKSGDNLGAIASKMKCTVSQLREWNNLRTSKLFVGQKLYVLQKQKVKAESANSTAANNKENNIEIKVADGDHAPGYNKECNCVYYEVKNGDTLWKISQKYPGLTVDRIKKSNNLKDGNEIKSGMKLKLEISSPNNG